MLCERIAISEDYDNIAAGLKDIIKEAKDLEIVTIEDRVYTSLRETGNI